LLKNIAGKEITPVDSLPKLAKVPFQNRVPFIVHNPLLPRPGNQGTGYGNVTKLS
jgi:hypothetical protein